MFIAKRVMSGSDSGCLVWRWEATFPRKISLLKD